MLWGSEGAVVNSLHQFTKKVLVTNLPIQVECKKYHNSLFKNFLSSVSQGTYFPHYQIRPLNQQQQQQTSKKIPPSIYTKGSLPTFPRLPIFCLIFKECFFIFAFWVFEEETDQHILFVRELFLKIPLLGPDSWFSNGSCFAAAAGKTDKLVFIFD